MSRKQSREFVCKCVSIDDHIWWREVAYVDGNVAEEVVRCKNCLHFDGEGCTLFDFATPGMRQIGFCAWGDRRSDED